MNYLTVVPAYGRDYKSQKAVKEAWNRGDDFIINSFMHPDNGRYMNRNDKTNDTVIHVRYAKLTKVVEIR